MKTGTNNGQRKAAEYDDSKPVYALRVFRVEPGMQVFVRMLSPEIRGVMTHFHRGRSQVCMGDDCPPAMHREKQFWKGYVACEFYDKKPKLWFPTVLEVTECLELDMRGIIERGQVWELFRHAEAKKGEPVRGALHETLDAAKLRDPFDIIPVLRTLYHCLGVFPASVKNPLPPRVLIQPTSDDAPQVLASQEAADSPASYDAEKGYAKRFEEEMRRRAEKTRK